MRRWKCCKFASGPVDCSTQNDIWPLSSGRNFYFNNMNARLPILLLFLALTGLPLIAQPVASVGSSVITPQHLTRRIDIERAYGGELKREAALVSLVNDAIEREVARGLGLLPDSSELLRFSQYADQS